MALDIEVKYGSSYRKTDKEIAKAAVNALDWEMAVPEEKIKVKVEDGWIYLSGEVQWAYQKNVAKKAVQGLLGVRGVSNTISLKSTIKPIEIKNRIKKAFERMASIDADGVTVETHDHTVTLRGKVNSIKEKEDAEIAAYNAPGVYDVKNELRVQYRTAYA